MGAPEEGEATHFALDRRLEEIEDFVGCEPAHAVQEGATAEMEGETPYVGTVDGPGLPEEVCGSRETEVEGCAVQDVGLHCGGDGGRDAE